MEGGRSKFGKKKFGRRKDEVEVGRWKEEV